jgi:hypothetical protein
MFCFATGEVQPEIIPAPSRRGDLAERMLLYNEEPTPVAKTCEL